MTTGHPEENRSNMLSAGSSKTDITPPAGTFVNGDFVSHYAQWIHDRLYSKALVLRWNETVIAIVVVDICVMPKELIDGVKQEIQNETGIPARNILISSTHTHAAGSVASVYLCAADLGYAKKLPHLVVQSVREALHHLKPARIAFGSADVPEHVRCRRYFLDDSFKPVNPVTGKYDKVKTNPFGLEHLITRPESATDPEVGFVAVQGLDGTWISLLANYSLHYVGDWPNGTISPDYFGAFSRAVQDKLGATDGFVAMMSNGTSGDINIWDFRREASYPTEDFKKSELIGRDIADKVIQTIPHLQWEDEPCIEVQYEEVVVAVRKPGDEELVRARKIIANSHYENLQLNEEGLKSIYAREQILLNELPGELLFPVQALRIGNGIIGAMGGEIFAQTGLWLKANASTKKYFTIGLANGNCGYLPPEHEFEQGGYETWRSRTSQMEEQAEEKIKNKLHQMVSAFDVHVKA